MQTRSSPNCALMWKENIWIWEVAVCSEISQLPVVTMIWKWKHHVLSSPLYVSGVYSCETLIFSKKKNIENWKPVEKNLNMITMCTNEHIRETEYNFSVSFYSAENIFSSFNENFKFLFNLDGFTNTIRKQTPTKTTD